MNTYTFILLAFKTKDLLEPGVVGFFFISVSILFSFTIRKFKKTKAHKLEVYNQAFDFYRKKADESTNPKYLHLLYKQVYKIRQTHRKHPEAYQVASETMRYILNKIDSLPRDIQQKYVQEHHHHHHPHHL